MYPLLSEYIDAIKSAENNFKELNCLRPVLGDDGQPIMTSGNFAVVFKMKDEQSGKYYAVKCFTREQEGRSEAYREIAKELENVSSPYIISIRYLEKELFVDTDQTYEDEFPILLMDWVAGKTLDKYIYENLDDKYALEILAHRFSLLAQWLIPQPFAHGDLKPDNILVREDGSIVLVDYDGMYVPSMKGQKARELGSPDFRHPLRTENEFDEHIDDFSLISILLSLKAISINPILLSEYGADGRLLLSRNDYTDINQSFIGREIDSILKNEDYRNLTSIMLLCLQSKVYLVNSLKILSVNFEGLNYEQLELMPRSLRETIEKAMLGNSDEQNSLGYCFYYGENLSQNYTKAIYWYKASATQNNSKALYNIGVCFQNGTGARQSYADALIWFQKAAELGDVDAQYNVGQYYRWDKYGIGIDLKKSYYWFKKAADQNMAEAQTQLGAFYVYGKGGVKKNLHEAFRLFKLSAQQGYSYGQYHVAKCFWEGRGVEINYNKAMEWYRLAANQGHKKALEKINQWEDSWWDGTSVRYSADKKLLKGVWSLCIKEYNIIEGTKEISDNAFCDLGSETDYSNLDKIVIPSSIKAIGHSPFNKYLSEIICLSPYFEVDNNTLYSKGKQRLIQCFAQTEEFLISEEVSFIDNHAFYGCKSKKIIISKNIQQMGVNPFIEMDSDETPLEVISLSSKFTVENNALYEDKIKLISYWGKDKVFTVPSGVNEIGEYSFWASQLKTINLPNSIEKIGDCAFGWCFSLDHILAPAEVAEKYKKIVDGYQDMIRIVK